MLFVAVKRLTPTATLPIKGSDDAACFDLHVDRAEADEYGWTVHTGLAVAIPRGFGMFIFPRSGLGSKLGLTLRNSTGVIDSDYRGEIMLKFNHGHAREMPNILEAMEHGSRIAQGTIIQVPDVQFMEAQDLDATVRGVGGFGSTGV